MQIFLCFLKMFDGLDFLAPLLPRGAAAFRGRARKHRPTVPGLVAARREIVGCPIAPVTPWEIKKIFLNIGIGRIAPGSFYRREIERRVNVAMCEKHYYDKDLTGGTGPLPISRENHIFGFSGRKRRLWPKNRWNHPSFGAAREFNFRDEFARDSVLQRRVIQTRSLWKFRGHRAALNGEVDR